MGTSEWGTFDSDRGQKSLVLRLIFKKICAKGMPKKNEFVWNDVQDKASMEKQNKTAYL